MIYAIQTTTNLFIHQTHKKYHKQKLTCENKLCIQTLWQNEMQANDEQYSNMLKKNVS